MPTARSRSRTLALIAGMSASSALVMALALWDAQREASQALEDFGHEQASLALATARDVRTQLELFDHDAERAAAASARGDEIPANARARYVALRVGDDTAPMLTSRPDAVRIGVSIGGRRVEAWIALARLLAVADRLEAPDPVVALVRAPGESEFRSTAGASVHVAALVVASERGAGWVRLARPEAAAVGLPARTAFAGLATTDAGVLGRWTIAVVSTARRERDREDRARRRFLYATLLVLAIVSAFGGLALRKERRELRLQQRLALAAIESERDAQLQRESRAATMLALAAGVAHEVSTPLGVIVGRAEQIAERAANGDERAERAARLILEQADRIREVVRGFLRLARGDTPAMEPVDPIAWVRSAAELVEHRFGRARVELRVTTAPTSRDVRGDRRLLEHALTNLLLNACDASRTGDVVDLELDVDERVARVVVSDVGSGIDPEIAAKVTQPFFSTKTTEGGTGVGLAIAQEIVTMHRGTLALAPRSPRGTVATIEIPIT